MCHFGLQASFCAVTVKKCKINAIWDTNSISHTPHAHNTGPAAIDRKQATVILDYLTAVIWAWTGVAAGTDAAYDVGPAVVIVGGDISA